MLDMANEEMELTEEEEREEILAHEDDYISGLLEAAKDVDRSVQPIEIIRKGRKYFTFRLHPLTDEEISDIRKRYTKYTKNRRQGIRVAEELDTPKYRASLIYNSTIEEDQRRFWDNPEIKKRLSANGKVIINALDVIMAVLLPGEIARIMDIIDDFNGYDNDELKADKEETAKK